MVEPPAQRPEVLLGRTIRYTTGCGKIYVTVNDWPDGEGSGPREIIARLGKAGQCTANMVEAVAKMASKALQHGADPDELAMDLIGQSCHKPSFTEGLEIKSCVDAIGKALAAAREETLIKEAHENGSGS